MQALLWHGCIISILFLHDACRHHESVFHKCSGRASVLLNAVQVCRFPPCEAVCTAPLSMLCIEIFKAMAGPAEAGQQSVTVELMQRFHQSTPDLLSCPMEPVLAYNGTRPTRQYTGQLVNLFDSINGTPQTHACSMLAIRSIFMSFVRFPGNGGIEAGAATHKPDNHRGKRR